MRLVFLVGALLGLLMPCVTLAGSIVGSYHDLTWIWDRHAATIGWQFTNNYHEVCIYCHTPHHATVAVPLWNRPSYDTTYDPYGSSSMSTIPGQPSAISRLCLSCHDGVIAVDAIVNIGRSQIDWADVHGHMRFPSEQSHSDCGFCHEGTFGDFRDGFLTTNLSNDHPISMEYVSDPELRTPPVSGIFENTIKLVDNRVECVSCHNVHDPDIKPFLRTSNAGSELCVTCHIK